MTTTKTKMTCRNFDRYSNVAYALEVFSKPEGILSDLDATIGKLKEVVKLEHTSADVAAKARAVMARLTAAREHVKASRRETVALVKSIDADLKRAEIVDSPTPAKRGSALAKGKRPTGKRVKRRGE